MSWTFSASPNYMWSLRAIQQLIPQLLAVMTRHENGTWKHRTARYLIKVCVQVKENANETFVKLKRVYGDDALSLAQVFRWHKAFSEGREIVENEPRFERPSSARTEENAAKILALVRWDRRLTVKMICSVLNLNSQLTFPQTSSQKAEEKGCSGAARNCRSLDAPPW